MPCQKNLPRSPVKSGDADELTGSLALTKSTISISRSQIPAVFPLVPSVIFALDKYINEVLHKITKLYIELFF